MWADASQLLAQAFISFSFSVGFSIFFNNTSGSQKGEGAPEPALGSADHALGPGTLEKGGNGLGRPPWAFKA